METIKPNSPHFSSDSDRAAWDAVLDAGVHAQHLVPGVVAVGGTAAALYAGHRFSQDTDHLHPSLSAHFDEIVDALESAPEWKTARVQSPVQILGSINGVQVGFRQARHAGPIEMVQMELPHGNLIIPTLDEMIGMKAFLAYRRNAVRDYLDFAALSQCADEVAVIQSLLKSDQRYGHLQQRSVAMEIAKLLTDPLPFDLHDLNITQYKGLSAKWQSWPVIQGICAKFGERFGKLLVIGPEAE